jgi:hypothetical protein
MHCPHTQQRQPRQRLNAEAQTGHRSAFEHQHRTQRRRHGTSPLRAVGAMSRGSKSVENEWRLGLRTMEAPGSKKQETTGS